LKFVFYSEPTFETWDWTNPDIQGIGGSETSHIEMAARLALRGHEVNSFAPVPWDEQKAGTVRYRDNVKWQHSNQFTAASDHADVYVIYRAPRIADELPEGCNAWLIFQDVDYRDHLTEERAAKFTRLVALCARHAEYLKVRYPFAAHKVCVSSNGIKRELIDQIALDPPERNPHRLIYASSPDRGMEYLLNIFPRAKEIIPDLELHLYYGFNNIDKLVERYGPDHFISRNAERLKQMTDQPGVTVHGRIGQPELLREWFKAGIWCHPSNFTETSCITCMDAQACGAIPLTQPLWAVGENVQHGVFIEGDVKSDLIQCRYVLELIRLAQPGVQEEIREDMMPWARQRFDWELIVDQWQDWAGRYLPRPRLRAQFEEAVTV
jgi:glycosyltransferase involved in cell wall biosynthesis